MSYDGYSTVKSDCVLNSYGQASSIQATFHTEPYLDKTVQLLTLSKIFQHFLQSGMFLALFTPNGSKISAAQE